MMRKKIQRMSKMMGDLSAMMRADEDGDETNTVNIMPSLDGCTILEGNYL